MTAAMTGFAFSDACMKALGQEMPLFQALFLRGCGTTLFLWVLTFAMGQARLGLPRRDWLLIAARVVIGWVYSGSGGSVLLAILLHASGNTWAEVLGQGPAAAEGPPGELRNG